MKISQKEETRSLIKNPNWYFEPVTLKQIHSQVNIFEFIEWYDPENDFKLIDINQFESYDEIDLFDRYFFDISSQEKESKNTIINPLGEGNYLIVTRITNSYRFMVLLFESGSNYFKLMGTIRPLGTENKDIKSLVKALLICCYCDFDELDEIMNMSDLPRHEIEYISSLVHLQLLHEKMHENNQLLGYQRN